MKLPEVPPWIPLKGFERVGVLEVQKDDFSATASFFPRSFRRWITPSQGPLARAFETAAGVGSALTVHLL